MYGEFVRAVREARALTQRELALVSGVGQSNISAIENNRRMPTADTLRSLLEACGFELTATAGNRTIFCSPPDDERRADALPGDPPDERPALAPGASESERALVVAAVLDAVDATRR